MNYITFDVRYAHCRRNENNCMCLQTFLPNAGQFKDRVSHINNDRMQYNLSSVNKNLTNKTHDIRQ